MDRNLLMKLMLKSTLKQRLITAGVILILLAFLLYKLMLASYLNNFNSLRAQLKAQKNLLNLKISRAGNLVRLNEECQKYEQELKEVNKSFFTEKEAEEFMKNLPKLVSSFGNQVVLLQPRSKGNVLTRSAKLKKYISSENLPAEKKLIDFIDNNQKAIDSGETTKEQLTQALLLLPEEKKSKFKEIWDQAGELDYHTGLKLRQINLEVVVRGPFKGILSLLDRYNDYNKVIKLEKMSILTGNQLSGVETRFFLNLYVIE